MIKFKRGMTVVLLFAFFGLAAVFIRYLIFPFQKTKMQNYETLQKSWNWFVGVLEKLKVINLNINNLEKIKNIKNSIIVSTHPSYIDIVILMSIIPHSTCFVARKLARNPFFKGMVKLLFILDTEIVDDWLNESCKKLDEGLNVIIFPMGSRHDNNEHPKIRRGTALIAQKSHKNIVALNLKTNSKFLQGHQPIYDAGKEAVQYNLDYIDEINTEEYLAKYKDVVTFKTEVTKIITKTLYNDQN